VLFKGGRSIEALSRIKAVCFDKTGTLTVGRPRVSEIHPVAWSNGEKLLAYAAALEEPSSHPIAAAIKDTARARGVEPAPLRDVTHTTGRGMSGFSGDCPVRLGSYVHAEELIPECFRQRVKDVLAMVQAQGSVAVVVSHACPDKPGGGEVAVIIMEDSVRPGAELLVPQLHELGVVQVRMLTGDNRRTAEHVATALRLDKCDAELLPEDKVRLVKQSKQVGPVAVIGDGVNDAPALAAADVSIGIGSIGTDAALENADIVLLSDDLSVVPWSLRLAKVARRTITINIIFALSIIAVMGTLILTGDWTGIKVPLSLGVLAHEGGTLLVVGHSLLLLAFASPKVGSVKPMRGPGPLTPSTPALSQSSAT
jgi:Cd2+/Zn2+-exporting ATPase